MLKPNEEAELRRRAKVAISDSGSDAAAVELLRLLVQLDDQKDIRWYQYGEALRSLGRSAEAEQALLKARSLAPEKNRCWVEVRLAMVATQRGQLQSAEEWFRLATDSEGCEGWPWVLRAVNLMQLESMPAARECLYTAKQHANVDLDEVLVNEGLIERYYGNYEGARNLAHRALEIDPTSQAARQLLTSIEGAIEARSFVCSLAERGEYHSP